MAHAPSGSGQWRPVLFKAPHSGKLVLAAIATFTLALIPRAGFGQLSTTAAALSKPSVTEVSLGTIDPGWIDYSLAISPDGKHIAYAAKREKGKCVVLDGHAGRTYPEIPEQHLTERGRDPQIRFSSQGGHITYVARRADSYVVVADEREGKPYEYIEVGAPVFSSDGNRLAYVAKLDGKELVVTDGKEGKPFDYLGVVPLRFSPDPKHLAYVARRGSSDFAVFDGEERSEGDYIGPITYSFDGSRYAYQVNQGESRRVVVDGVAGRPYPRLGNEIIFSADGKHVLYRATSDAGDFLVVDGVGLKKTGIISENDYGFSPDGRPVYTLRLGRDKYYIENADQESGPYDFVIGSSPRFSSDGKHVAFEARRRGKVLLVVDGVETPEFDEIELAAFSEDGSRFLYTGKRGGKQYLVVDGKPTSYDSIGDAVFGTDGKHLAVSGQSGGKWFVELDGKRVKAINGQVTMLTFTTAGTLVLVARHGEQLTAVVDGVEQKAYADIGDMRFTDDGKHVVYSSLRPDRKAVVVVDGFESPAYDSILSTPVIDRAGVICFVARRAGGFLRVCMEPGK